MEAQFGVELFFWGVWAKWIGLDSVLGQIRQKIIGWGNGCQNWKGELNGEFRFKQVH